MPHYTERILTLSNYGIPWSDFLISFALLLYNQPRVMAASYNEMSILINGLYLSACVIMQNWNSRFNKQGGRECVHSQYIIGTSV